MLLRWYFPLALLLGEHVRWDAYLMWHLSKAAAASLKGKPTRGEQTVVSYVTIHFRLGAGLPCRMGMSC